MAREVMIHTWCDVCIAEDGEGGTRRVPSASSHELTLDGKAWTLDLCEDHDTALYKPFAALVAYGAAAAPATAPKAAKAAPRAAAPGAPRPSRPHRPATESGKALPIGVVCPVAHCGQPYYGRTLGALQQHMRTIHEVGMEGFGEVCPMCAGTFAQPAALASHVRAAHTKTLEQATDPGVDLAVFGYGMAAAWWWASNHGDPYGVVGASGLPAWVAGGQPDELPLGA